MSDQQKLYAPPSLSALTAYVSTAVVLFFAGFNLNVFSDLERLKGEFEDLREENAVLKYEIATLREEQARADRYMQAPRELSAVPTPPRPPRMEVSITPPTPAAGGDAVGEPIEPEVPGETPEAHADATPGESGLGAGEIALAAPPQPATDASDSASAPDPVAESPAVLEMPEPEVPATVSSPSLSGRIVATNVDQQRAIISLGSSNGVQSGQRFQVYRGEQWVGDLTVVRVFADMSMCDITQPTTRGMRKDDLVRLAVAGEAGAE